MQLRSCTHIRTVFMELVYLNLPDDETTLCFAFLIKTISLFQELDILPQHVEVDTTFWCVHDASASL